MYFSVIFRHDLWYSVKNNGSKSIKKLVKIVVWGIVLFLALIIFIWLYIQNSQVQSMLINEATAYLERNFKVKVNIKSVDIQPFNKIILNNVLINDLNKDTLIAADKIRVSLLWFNTNDKVLTFKKINLVNADINFNIDSLGNLNLESIINKLSPPDTVPSPPSSKPFAIEIQKISIENSRFRLSSFKPSKQAKGINFEDMDLRRMNIEAQDFGLHRDTISMVINSLNCVDKSGFDIEKFRAEFSLCNKHINFDKLRIKSHGSNLQFPYLHLSFESMNSMSRFLQEVKIDAQIENSLLKTQTLGYIVPELANYDIELILNGKVKGTVSDLRAKNMLITSGTQTRIATSFHISGLPNIEKTMMIVDFKELSTSLEDIEQFKYTKTNEPIIKLPAELNELKKITYKGNFTGFINNFVAFGSINSAIGKISLDLSIKPDTTQNTEFNGNVSTTNLDLGKLLKTTALGRISLSAMVKGTSDKNANLQAFTDATVSRFELNNYDYSIIKINGNLTNSTYIGTVALDNPNCKLDFLGRVDFSDSIPVFDFSAFVPKIDLVKTKINTTDTISQASFLLTAKFSGNNLDNSKGEIKIVNSWYKNQNGEFKLSEIKLSADNNKDSKLIAFQSEFAEGELRSKYNYSNIFSGLKNLLYIYIPALKEKTETEEKEPIVVENPQYNDYIIKLRLKKTKKITDVLTPDIKIAENTSVFGIFNPDLNTFTLKVKVPELTIGTKTFKDILVDGQTKDSIFEATISTPQLNLGKSAIRNINLSTKIEKNRLDVAFGWDNKQSPTNKGTINAIADFNPSILGNGSLAIINFKQSEFIINDSVWTVSPSSIKIDTSNIAINEFKISNQRQSLFVTGSISKNPSDSVQINLDNLDISNANFYLKSIGYELGGRINGFARINDIYNSPTLFADIGINKFAANKRHIGNVNFNSEWFSNEKRLSLNLKNIKNDTTTFEADGNMFIETGKLDFKVDIERIFLQHFSPILEGVASNLAGKISGNLAITGTTNKPLVNGDLNINDGTITIDFMKAPYTINDKVILKNSDIILKNFKILDSKKHVAKVDGEIKTGYFGNFNLNLNVSPSNFQCINTTERDNELFYGTVYASGLVTITGKPDDINMNIAVRTDNNTILFLPLSSNSEVTKNNFITFTSKNSDEIFIEEAAPEKEESSSTNMNLSFDLQVTPEAEVQIIIDKKLGDIIKASGSGNLKMDVNPKKDLFKIYGDYNIEKGDYLFTLQGVINKKFKIDAGSTLSWDGDPTDATMNIKAIYLVRTPLKDLLYDYSGKYENRVPVNCQIQLTQKLMSPGIKFNIELPNVDNETKLLAESALNTEDNINKQFLSLLVIGSFLPPSKDIVDQNSTATNQQSNSGLTSGLGNSLSELLSNQLSNWVSQLSKSFDFGFNYRPGSSSNNLNSDQIEVAISTQLLDDRVTVNGNMNYGNRSNSSSIAGDFNIDIKLNKSGKFRFKAFARSNDEIISTTSEQTYTTGAGIVYREDFNNFKDLMHRIKNTFNQDPVIVPLKEPVPQHTDTTSTKKTETLLFPKKKKS